VSAVDTKGNGRTYSGQSRERVPAPTSAATVLRWGALWRRLSVRRAVYTDHDHRWTVFVGRATWCASKRVGAYGGGLYGCDWWSTGQRFARPLTEAVSDSPGVPDIQRRSLPDRRLDIHISPSNVTFDF